MPTHTLILLRHGASEWNQKNLFNGWVDTKLSDKGKQDAAYAGERLLQSGILPDVVHTSCLSRSIQTANIVLEVVDRLPVDVHHSWRLNERHYGALQGRNRRDIAQEYGEEKYMLWRRSYDVAPPPIDDNSEFSPVKDRRYGDLPNDAIPRTESLKDVEKRLVPYYDDVIGKDLKHGNTVLVIAHSNSLRALVKHIDRISDEDIVGVNIPNGMPFIYELDDDLRPVRDRYYLDPDAAAAGAAAVANQGQ